jgi:hypothetical protein
MRLWLLIVIIYLAADRLGSSQTNSPATTNGVLIIKARPLPPSTRPAEPAGESKPTPPAASANAPSSRVERVRHLEPAQTELEQVTPKLRPASFD